MKLINADSFANNVKTWANNIRSVRNDNKCFFTEEDILNLIDKEPITNLDETVVDLESKLKMYVTMENECEDEHYRELYHKMADVLGECIGKIKNVGVAPENESKKVVKKSRYCGCGGYISRIHNDRCLMCGTYHVL